MHAKLYLQTQLERVGYMLASCTNQHLNFGFPATPPSHALCKNLHDVVQVNVAAQFTLWDVFQS